MEAAGTGARRLFDEGPLAALRSWAGGRSYPMLDAVRAVAATSVFCRHTGLQLGLTGTAAAFAEHLEVGLTIFFVLSGFLLYRPFARAGLTGVGVDVPRFALGRLLRIVPAYWVALTLVLLIGSTPPLGDALRYYLFAQVYDVDTVVGGIGQAWTLDIEMTFYVLLPVAAFALRAIPVRSPRARLMREAGSLLALAMLSEAAKVWYFADGVYLDLGLAWLSHTFVWFADAFVAGMAIALLLEWRGRDGVRTSLGVRRAWPFWTAALALYVARSGFDSSFDPGYAPIAGHLMDVAVALLFFVPAVSGALRAGPARRFLTSRLVTYLGIVSYSFYLYHFVVITHVVPFGEGWSSLPFVAAAFGLSVLIALASWYLVERTAMRLRDLIVPSPGLGPSREADATAAP